MLFYSHWLDLIGKLLSLAVFIGVFIATGIDEVLRRLFEQTPNPEFFFFLTMTGLAVLWFFVIHRPLIDVFITKYYVKLRFDVMPSWSEAKRLRRLFCLNAKMEWQPMKHVRLLPFEQRLKALLSAT